MRTISCFLAFVTLAFGQATNFSSHNATRLRGVNVCAALPVDTNILTYSLSSACWKAAAPAAAGPTGSGTTDQFTYWTGAATLGSHQYLVNGLSNSYTADSPALKDTLGCSLYLAHNGGGPVNSRLMYDCLSATSDTYNFKLVDKNSNTALFSSSGSGWTLSGTTITLPTGSPTFTNLINLTSQSASIGSTSLLLSAYAASDLVLYRIVSRSGAGTVTLTITWNDEAGHSQSFTTPSITLVGQQSGSLYIGYANDASGRYSTTVAGSISYDVFITHSSTGSNGIP